MEINTLGVVINYYRFKYKFRIANICEGICSRATLYRIEYGSKELDSLSSETLLGRIGQEVTQFELVLNEEDYKRWEMRDKIAKYEEENRLDKIEIILEKYRTLIPEEKNLHLQFCDYYDSKLRLNALEHNKIPEKDKLSEIEEINRVLYKALSYSKPSFIFEKEKKQVYSPMEIELILLLIHYEYREWEHKNKEKKLLEILNFVKNIYSERVKEKMGIKILTELVHLSEKEKNDKKIIKYADDAIDFISQGRGVKKSAYFHFIKAKTMGKQYKDSDNSEILRKDCIEECLMAYYVYDIMNQLQERDEVEKYCKETLGWHITKQETLSD